MEMLRLITNIILSLFFLKPQMSEISFFQEMENHRSFLNEKISFVEVEKHF